MRLTIGEALLQAKPLGVDRLDAQLILGHLLGRNRTWIIAHSDDVLEPSTQTLWASMLERRCAGEPVAYLLGQKEFHGLVLKVTPDVLVPRPDTETLVVWALEYLQCMPPGAQTLDLGTGSGAIALSIKNAHTSCTMTAVDLSAAALEVARTNATEHQVAIEFLQGPWWTPVSGRTFDLVVSNPPYVAEGDPHLDALSFEPQQALTSGPEGLDDLQEIILAAPGHLRPGAWLLLEHGHDQSLRVQKMLLAQGFQQVQSRLDTAGVARCTGGRWPE